MADGTSADDLLQRWRAGEEQAADEIYHRYARRLWRLIESGLDPRLRRRIDPDDVLQSAFRTFFRRTARGEYHVDQSGSLWQLLVRITLNKLRHHAEHHLALRRSVTAEINLPDNAEPIQLAARDPTPQDVVLMLEELECLQAAMDPDQIDMIRLCFEGHSVPEIAATVGVSRWTVRRVLNRTGEWLKKRLDHSRQRV